MTKTLHKVTKECAGFYTVTVDGSDATCELIHYEQSRGDTFDGWIARVRGDRYAYTDPLPTKREAVWQAIEMLQSDV